MPATPIRWLFQMAWRDSRRSRARLLLFVSSIIIGIAALVAINSFSENLQKDIQSEAKTLLGADLVLQGNQPAPPPLAHWASQLEGQKARSLYFASMAYFPRSGDTRLSQIRVLEGNFPFYGKIATEPADAYLSFHNKQAALVDKTLMMQFGLAIGDSVRVGELNFTIEGQLNASPGRAGIAASIAPAIYIPMKYLEATELVKPGSRVFYQYYYTLPDTTDMEAMLSRADSLLEKHSFRAETVESRKENVREAFGNVANFLNLVGFIALLLGCIGVASAVHIYIKGKIKTVAVLRCLGASGRQAFLIYLIQIIFFSAIGSVLGALLGSALQLAIPAILSDFLPIEKVSSDISGFALGQGILTGLLVATLFALLPLLSIRHTSPLLSLRAQVEPPKNNRDPVRWLVLGGIAAFVCLFSYWQTGEGWEAFFFSVGIGLALLLLAGLAKLVVWSVRRFFPSQWSYVWRQSIANLYRPNNQTLTLIVSIGLGTALISTLFFVQDLLLNQVQLSGSGEQPNMILFDIQPSQKEEVAQLVTKHRMPLRQQVPIITMRLDNIDGIDKMAYLKDTSLDIREWVYNREYRVTYRDTLIDSEEIVEGVWHTEKADADSKVYVSLEEGFAESMNASPGTRLTFNVQGALVETEVGSIRKVNWNRLQTNFFVLFPTGVLEDAPQFDVIVSRVSSAEQSAGFQRELVRSFPNVSVIDLGQILKSIDEVLSKVSFVIRFMALFSILTGLLVLISSVVLSKYQRIRESVLLRTIGASRRQILQINALEYLMLGLLATLTGIILAIIASWALAFFSFHVPYLPRFWPALVTLLAITSIILFIGLMNSRQVVNKPPLEVLRAEV